ncbi:protein phosphatase 1 regulatory subunit 15B isoform X1 [Clinocottus analis]|uniref:protein phosphatase 1 regulatory subunit 15B isoform X1 n=1 Tax=Clinocottus analis TaxID=304258 RepID=UPI0035C21415
MLTNMSGDGSSSAAGHGVASPGLAGQESSWIGLLSRPAMAFLQRYLPGRPQIPIRADAGAGWILGGGLKTSFVDEESDFLRQLDDMMPASHLTHMRCQHEGAAGPLEPRGGSGTLPWLTADSLLEMGIQTPEELDLNICQQTQIGYLSSVRTFFSHVLLSSVSFQDIKPTEEPVGPPVKSGRSRTWWGSFWLSDESLQNGPPSDVSRSERVPVRGGLCPQRPAAETKAPKTTDLFVHSWTLGETAGPTDLKEDPSNNRGLQTVQNAEKGFATTDHRLAIGGYLSRSGAAAACSEVALLTPDQDNGYSSLEEEHFQVCRLSAPTAPSEEREADAAEIGPADETMEMEMEEETSAEVECTSGNIEEEEEEEDSVEPATLADPQCQNKAIAFIMGCPCSDDESSSQSDGESSDDDDDAGFDSEGVSDQSESTDDEEEEDDDEEDDEASDSEVDSEAERLWNSLCQSADPYNPRNFTARLHTSSPPRAIPAPAAPSSSSSSAQSTPDSCPDVAPLPLAAVSSSPTSGSDFWDDSTSASEADEAESLRLLSSFSCSADPYSPFNFQATLRTVRPAVEAAGPRARSKAKKTSQTASCLLGPNPAASPPKYKKEEAEERLDSGFSELSTSTSAAQTGSATKKVRFCDDVEEFFASCSEEEDRRGPWEELARDRCRFLRRCQDVEQSIAYCLTPQHRRRVSRRLVQDA